MADQYDHLVRARAKLMEEYLSVAETIQATNDLIAAHGNVVRVAAKASGIPMNMLYLYRAGKHRAPRARFQKRGESDVDSASSHA